MQWPKLCIFYAKQDFSTTKLSDYILGVVFQIIKKKQLLWKFIVPQTKFQKKNCFNTLPQGFMSFKKRILNMVRRQISGQVKKKIIIIIIVSDCIEYALLRTDIILLVQLAWWGFEYCPHTYCCFLVQTRGKSEKVEKKKWKRNTPNLFFSFSDRKEREINIRQSATSSTLLKKWFLPSHLRGVLKEHLLSQAQTVHK